MSDSKTTITNATYFSKWENGAEILFPCRVNLNTKEVLDIKIVAGDLDNYNVLLGEHIMFPDGKMFEVRPKCSVPAESSYFWYDDDRVTPSEENISITLRDINGKRQIIKFSCHSAVVEWASEVLREDDEVLLVVQDNLCLYSALWSDHPLFIDDLTGFFA